MTNYSSVESAELRASLREVERTVSELRGALARERALADHLADALIACPPGVLLRGELLAEVTALRDGALNEYDRARGQ